MTVKTIGLDQAKEVFQVHGISESGSVIFNKAIKRAKLLALFEALPPCTVGMEACGSSHHWGRTLRQLGHDVRLMPANYVRPYVKRGKTDAADAEAICEAYRAVNLVALAGLFAIFACLLTNEYITAPMIWFLFGSAMNRNLLPLKDAQNVQLLFFNFSLSRGCRW